MSSTLVAYDSLTHTTREIAEEIGRILHAAGVEVSTSHVDDVGDATLYDFVILGAPIRGGKWVSGAHDFLERHAEELADRPIAVFAVGGSLRPDNATPAAEETVRAAVDTVTRAFPRLEVIDTQLFAGRIDRALLPPAMRLLSRLARLPEGDWRDWDAIRGWATALAPRVAVQP
jgi:menaquinone-dependent protoporphyrinogen oxidase